MVEIKKTLFFFILFFSSVLFAQTNNKVERKGKVSYRTSKNIYVKYDDTKGIKPGDFLFKRENGKLIPVIKAKYISKRSISGELLNGIDVKVGDYIYALIIKKENKNKIKDQSKNVAIKNERKWKKYVEQPKIKKVVSPYSQNISGRVTVNSTSNFSNFGTGFNYQRWRYSIHLNAENINNSRLSINSYSTFTYRADQWADIKRNLSKALKIYDLSLKYRINDNTNIWGGRHLNRTISNISAVDGFQIEHSFKSFSLGAVAGFRPDFIDMSINTNLFEFGVYLNKQSFFGHGVVNNTVAFFQQNNNSKTDRRFLYFQHTNNIFKGLYFFASSEIDLFKREMGVNKNSVTLTSLYLSANIRPSRFISFNISYDARKDVIYYETFRTFLDSVINNETRQGLRIRTTIHPIRKVTIGSHFGYRYRKGDVKPNRNYGGFISYSKIPVIGFRPTFNYNRILSSFIDGNVWGIKLSRNLYPSSVYLTVGYKKTSYTFSNGSGKSIQKNISTSISSKLFNSFFMSINYEGIFEGNQSNGHFYVTLSTRF